MISLYILHLRGIPGTCAHLEISLDAVMERLMVTWWKCIMFGYWGVKDALSQQKIRRLFITTGGYIVRKEKINNLFFDSYLLMNVSSF